MNSLVDPGVIEALYAASQAGVRIDLIVRGICCLRPGVPGVSENIRVISIVDKFLEHSRITYFQNGDEPEVFLSSADWMPRNFRRRVEIMFPIEDPRLKNRIVDGILGVVLIRQRQGPRAPARRHLPPRRRRPARRARDPLAGRVPEHGAGTPFRRRPDSTRDGRPQLGHGGTRALRVSRPRDQSQRRRRRRGVASQSSRRPRSSGLLSAAMPPLRSSHATG